MSSPLELIPVSYLNAFVYCPRRFYFEFVRGMFEDNDHTVEGRALHRLVDTRGKEARPIQKEDMIHRRSVSLSSERLGIIGNIDLVEERPDGKSYPVEYKKGKKPKNRGPWLNDQVQLCAQALLMQDNGLPLPDKGYLYYIGSRARVEVAIDDDLIQQTEKIIAQCFQTAHSDELPPLVENRNKCFACSLNMLCLPEEEEVEKGIKANARRVLPHALDGDILYVTTIGAYVTLSDSAVKVSSFEGEEIGKASLETLREIVLAGPAQITTQTVHACLSRNIPIHYMNLHGRYLGIATPMLHYHGLLREAQWRAYFDKNISLGVAREIVCSKISNMRTLAMRYLRENKSSDDDNTFKTMKDYIKKARLASDCETLRGYEGIASRLYFSIFGRFVKEDRREFFSFKDRNRRPPHDPVNALLSYGYSMLARDCTGTGIRVGFDPYCGFYHSMKYGRPSLALDIMEFFRQPLVDSAVLTAINNGVFKESDFFQYQGVCYLNEKGRKKFIVHYEMRKKDMVTHPEFHYRMSYERTIELQFRLLGKFLLSEIDSYKGFQIR